MNIEKHFAGNYIKNGERYRLTPEEGDTMPTHKYAQENGFDRAQPLSKEELQVALAQHNEARRAEYLARTVSKPKPVPSEVPLWAFRSALLDAGLLDSVMSAIQSLPAQQSAQLLNFIEYGNYISRNSPSLISLAQALNKTSEEIDEMFRIANNKKL